MRCGDIIGGDNINAIGFIGAGKCGMSLAYYFRSKGVNVIGFSSRSNNTEDFELYSREKLINNSDIIFITTNDDNIQTVWNKIKDMNLKEKIICHCSGSVSSEIFKGADTVSEILSLCGNRFKIITPENKAKYHAAACFASNFVVSVCYKATELLQECGFSKSESESALSTLMKCNMDNILKVGCEKAITGPAARGDMATVEKHIEVLDEKIRKLTVKKLQCLQLMITQRQNLRTRQALIQYL